jgi:putative ABC transport system substrate-binding protein
VLRATNEGEIDAAFAELRERKVYGVLMASDPFFFGRRSQIAQLSVKHAMPVVATGREYVTAGNLVSYGTNIPDAYRQMGVYARLILKGASPADLPVVQPTKFELVVNLTTAKALGVELPPTLLARADEVIE